MEKEIKVSSSSRNLRKQTLSTSLKRKDPWNTSSDGDQGFLNGQGSRNTRPRNDAQSNGDTSVLRRRLDTSPRTITPHASTSRSAPALPPDDLLRPNLLDYRNHGNRNVSHKIVYFEIRHLFPYAFTPRSPLKTGARQAFRLFREHIYL